MTSELDLVTEKGEDETDRVVDVKTEDHLI